MSLYGAMITGISGLDANSQAMSIYSSNIANVNTVGYKDVEANFSTLLTSMFGNPDAASVTAAGEQNVTQQGLLQSATSPTDLGISGNGFFVVSQSASNAGAQYYTRAGNFTPDSAGNLQNGAGYYLMGMATDANGNVQSGAPLTPINISGLSGKAEATSNVTLAANLQSSATEDDTYTVGDMIKGVVQPDFSTTINVYDSQGGTQPITMDYIKTGANTWAYEGSYTGNQANILPAQNPILTGTMTFNTDGSLANANSPANPATGSVALTIPWNAASGLSAQTINLNMGTVGSTSGVTQFDSPSVENNTTVDGALFGNLTGVAIDSNGYVTANFSNGLSEKIYQVPLATFANEDGLAAVQGDAYQASSQSGTANVNAPNTGASGGIQSSELESSTVDLASEFTNLITTQRAYSASARIVTTADEMLQTLEQLPSQ
jgi:flagellar hook protein FlgE